MKFLVMCLIGLTIANYSWAQDGYAVGSKVSDFSLATVGGGKKSLSDYSDKKGVVLVFHSISCPFAKLYEPRIQSLISEYDSRGVAFLFIDYNNANGEETPAEIVAYLAKQNLSQLTYLIDANHKITTQFGATKVPEVFILKNVGGSFMLFYKGAIDNTPSAAEPNTENYLQDGIKALLGNLPLKVTTKKASGCAIEDY